MISVVAGLSTGHKIGLALVGGLFICFAVSAALIIPARWPDFPGRAGLGPFLAVTSAFFVGMMLAVWFLAKESESEAKSAVGKAAHIADVTEVDYKIKLPATTIEHGSYTFHVQNKGPLDRHNLTIAAPGFPTKATPTLPPQKSTDLNVDLPPGTYELYCSVPGHKALGMDVKLTVT